MSFPAMLRALETAAKNYLEGVIPLLTIYQTEDAADIPDRQAVFVLCPRGQGSADVPGCYLCELRVELRTALNLFEDRAAARAAHDALFEQIETAMTASDLADQLAASGSVGINGIHTDAPLTHDAPTGRLANSITRNIFATPQPLLE